MSSTSHAAAGPSSSGPLRDLNESPLICIALVGYDGVVHWNVHFTARRASLPIDPNIASLYAAWGVVSSADVLLSSYEHPILKPSSVALADEDAKKAPAQRLLPPIHDMFGTTATTLISVASASGGGSFDRVEANAVDVNGCVLIVFTKVYQADTTKDDPYARPRISGTPVYQQLACKMGAIVRCTCRPPSDSALVAAILDPLAQIAATAWKDRPEEVLRTTTKYWETPLTLKQLHQSIVSIGSALVMCVFTECL